MGVEALDKDQKIARVVGAPFPAIIDSDPVTETQASAHERKPMDNKRQRGRAVISVAVAAVTASTLISACGGKSGTGSAATASSTRQSSQSPEKVAQRTALEIWALCASDDSLRESLTKAEALQSSSSRTKFLIEATIVTRRDLCGSNNSELGGPFISQVEDVEKAITGDVTASSLIGPVPGMVTDDEALQLQGIADEHDRLSRALMLKLRAGQAVVTRLVELRQTGFPGRTAVYRPSSDMLYQAMTKVVAGPTTDNTGSLDAIKKTLALR
jgi:hypothetical protein